VPERRRRDGDDLARLDEEEGGEADEHVSTEAGPLAGGLALEADEAAAEERRERLGEDEQFLRSGVEHATVRERGSRKRRAAAAVRSVPAPDHVTDSPVPCVASPVVLMFQPPSAGPRRPLPTNPF